MPRNIPPNPETAHLSDWSLWELNYGGDRSQLDRNGKSLENYTRRKIRNLSQQRNHQEVKQHQ